jgi:uncharacterized membrane protein HdeD (DUF308 family)/predicted flap endonuclease-1-like 5' DNA nuclease
MSATTAVSGSDEATIPWWLVLIEGIALVVLGLLLLAKPGMTTLILLQLLGIYWLLVGMFKIVSIFIDSTAWGWKLFAGIVGIIAGMLVFRHPLWGGSVLGATLIVFLGIAGVIMGAISLYQAFKGAGWGTGILGVVELILGILLLANVWLFTFSLPWTIGILALIGGIVAIIGSFRIRAAGGELAPSVPAAAPAAAVVPQEEAPSVPVAQPTSPKPAEAEPVGVAEVSPQEVVVPMPVAPEEAEKFSADPQYIEGIGPVYGQQLKDAGIGTLRALLEQGATRRGRDEIVEKTGISHKLILEWVNHVDLYRVKGVGSEYADLLEAAGVDTVPELAQRNPRNLHVALVAVNEEKKLVRRVPVQSQVEDWVAQAKELPRVVTYY